MCRYFTTSLCGRFRNNAYQELKSFLTAAGENLSTSSPLPVPAVALVCPVEVCPIRNRRQVPLGNLFIRLPFTMTPITIPFSSFKGSTSAIATVSLLAVASVSIRHTAPDFPSYWLIIGWLLKRIFSSFSSGFHLAASRSSAPGSVPSGVHENRK